MMELRRTETTAVRLILDRAGAAELLLAFRQALRSGRAPVRIRLEPSVVSRRGTSSRDEVVTVVRSDVTAPSLARDEGRFTWALHVEDLESGAAAVERAMELGYFFPAEFLRLRVPKRKRLDWIFAEWDATA